jgi:hypothetical protein
MRKLQEFPSLFINEELDENVLDEKAEASYISQLYHILGDVSEGISNMKEDISAALWLLDQKELGPDAKAAFEPRLDRVISQLRTLDDAKEEIDDMRDDVKGYT